MASKRGANLVRPHGEQEDRFFRYYDCYCYLPFYTFCGRHLLAARRRYRGRHGPLPCRLFCEPIRARLRHSVAGRSVSREVLGDVEPLPLDMLLETGGGVTDATESLITIVQSTIADLRVIG